MTPPFSRTNSAAPTISSIVTARPIGVRRHGSSIASLSRHAGLSPTIPEWIALTRIGASSTCEISTDKVDEASVWTLPVTPPLTVLTVVEPGYGRSRASPPNTTIDAP